LMNWLAIPRRPGHIWPRGA